MKEFLEVTTEQTTCQKKNQMNKVASLTANDCTETDGYDSDHYSEIDATDQVGNVDTLVDDADIKKTKMIRYLLLHQEKGNIH